jgi:hypothetical protein
VTLAAHLFGLPNVSQARLELAVVMAAWGWWPTCSLSVSWHGEVFHGLGVQSAKVSTLPGASPLPSVAPAHLWLSNDPDSRSSCCLRLCPSCHFGMFSVSCQIFIS